MQTEEQMIFIENDGLGNNSSFYFVQNMLERYKDHDQIAYIGGVNYGPTISNESYSFLKLSLQHIL
ncbi:MAG: hypothetical protein PHG58_02395 [Clostridia bacterium]|nr:hypothetical protein [Clostridia bacterium]